MQISAHSDVFGKSMKATTITAKDIVTAGAFSFYV